MTDWITASGVLLAGLVVGFMIIYSLRRKVAPASAGDLERRDLESRRDALLRQLRETEAGSEERAQLERDAADVLRKLEEPGRKISPHPASGHPLPQAGEGDLRSDLPLPLGEGAAKRRVRESSGVLKGFLWGAGSVAALGLLGFFVYQSTVERKENDGLTGGGPPQVAQGQSQSPAQGDATLQSLEEAVRKNPEDLKLRNDLAKAYFDSENMMAVFEQTKYVLERAPNDARSLTYQALVRTAMGQMDRARDMLQSATKADPTFIDAWVSLAWVQMQLGRSDESRKAIDEAIRRRPEESARLEELFGQMRQRASSGSPTPTMQPGLSPPTPATPAASASGPSIAITLNSARQAPSNAVIFVTARAEGVTSGPPIAVKRVAAGRFPLQLQLTSADSMMGQQLPRRVRIEARVDSDGNAMTKAAGDLAAAQDGVAVGSSISLTLQ